MSLVIIFGPPAVGKMTVGQELATITGLKLFHNHATIELALKFFPFGDAAFSRLVANMRRQVMEEVAASDLPGLIFTYVWAFDDPSDQQAVEGWAEIFKRQGRRVLFVELEASKSARMERDGLESRLAEKPSKRDRAASIQRLQALDLAHKLNSTSEFEGAPGYVRIDNTDLSAPQVAKLVRDAFRLSPEFGCR
jgi:hypothetical protein